MAPWIIVILILATADEFGAPYLQPVSFGSVGSKPHPALEFATRVAIIGQDDRRKMTPVERKKYNYIGKFWSPSPNGTNGTGNVTLERDVVVTAAHVFYDEWGRLRTDPSTIKFYIETGKYDRDIFTPFEIESIVTGYDPSDPNPYDPSDLDPRKDFAVVRLKQMVPQHIIPLQIASGTDEGRLAVAAYSNDFEKGVVAHIGYCDEKRPDIFMTDYYRRNRDVFVFYPCDTNNLASGSAIVRESSGRLEIVGVHRKAAGDGNLNYGVRVVGRFKEAIEAAAGRISEEVATTQPLRQAFDFTLRPGTDLPGGDIDVLKGATLDRCQTACGDNSSCKAFTYNEAAKWCFLKGSGYGSAPHEVAISGEKVLD